MHPDKIGRYKIKEELGRGEIGAVYRAFDPSFNREVAIKVLPLELMRNLKILARFRRELKMIALLEHPAIVPVYDVGEENGQPYYVMRYMSGGQVSVPIVIRSQQGGGRGNGAIDNCLEADEAVKVIAVLPFKPLASETRNESLELGMADTLITKLGGIGEIIVRPVSATPPAACGQVPQADEIVPAGRRRGGGGARRRGALSSR